MNESVLVLNFNNNNEMNWSCFNKESLKKGIIIALKNNHYWIINCKESKKIKMENNKYIKPTVIFKSINENIDQKIKREIFKCGLDCNVCFKASNIYNLTSSQSKKTEENILNESGVVYMFSCKVCLNEGINNRYIGETGRKLSERKKEHFRLDKNKKAITEVSRHAIDTHKCNEIEWDIKILDRDMSDVKRKIKEAVWINKLKPELNLNKGTNVIGLEYFK